jgi:hypothetical protein
MKKTLALIFLLVAFATTQAFAQNPNTAPQNPSAKGEMKESGSEVKEAGKSVGHHTRHGRLVSGGKDFGRHMGRAGKHFGRGVKKTTKRVVK